MKNNIKINLKQFYKQYNLQERNYNLIISSPNGYGKFEFIEAVMEKYFQDHNISVKSDVFAHPDVYYLSLPLYDKSGKLLRVINNNERLLYEFGFEEKIDNCRVGSEITIDQVRDLSKFTSITSHYNHKFIVINNCNYLNKESSAALLKTLEETNSPAIFFLLTSEKDIIQDTIISRCHNFKFKIEPKIYSGASFFDYYLSQTPKIQNFFTEFNYMSDYDKIENELEMLFRKKINPLSLSDLWSNRGNVLIDYLLSFFAIMMKGDYLNMNSRLKNLYLALYEKISISSDRSIEIIRLLLQRKKDLYTNVNKKLFYDDLLIVLNEKLY